MGRRFLFSPHFFFLFSCFRRSEGHRLFDHRLMAGRSSVDEVDLPLILPVLTFQQHFSPAVCFVMVGRWRLGLTAPLFIVSWCFFIARPPHL